MPTCPTCFTKYPDGAARCTADGVELVPDATFAHVDRDIAPGTTVGEYTVEAKLGEGGFCAVYRAVHPLIGKRAAVKVLSREFSSNPQMVSRFIAEARAVNQIRHRNIIDIFSFGQLADGRQYYIMELLEGMSFDAYLASKKRLDLAEALPIFRGIARALDAAHAKGILHRDLKPENVYLVRHDDGGFEPKLLDFGLVKLLDATKQKEGSGGSHNTKTGTPMGTPYYMSPEQCRGLEVDPRTDVYSFGAMAFEVLTGEVPFTGTSTLDILVQHMNSPPPSASARCPAVPPSLDGPLAQILAKDPNGRPAHVGEAVDFLARAAGLPVDSQRRFQLDSASLSAAERAVAPTVMLDGAAVTPHSGPSGSSVSSPATPAQTFLDAATSIEPPRKSRAPLIVASVLALCVGASAVVAIGLHGRAPPAPAPLVQASSAPAATTVELRIDGIPTDTTVTADGVLLGTGGGPFQVPRQRATKLQLTAKGYKPKELGITPDENMLISVSLERDVGPAAATSAVSVAPAPAPTPAPKHAAPAGSKIHHDLETF
ncbi:MAG: serine/threonine-protein kinase [Labilithrix sp.]